MSATLSTTNYGLPLYTGTDYANFFDMNTTNNKLDETLKSIDTTAQSADTKANANADAITQTNDAVHSNMESITHIEQDLLSVQANVNNLVTQTGNTDTKVAGIEQTVQVQGEQLTENTQSIAQNAQNITKAQNDINNLESQTTENTSDISTLKNYNQVKSTSITFVNQTVTPVQIGTGLYSNNITINTTNPAGAKIISLNNLSVTNRPVTSVMTYEINLTQIIIHIISPNQMNGTSTVTGYANYYEVIN